MKDAPEIELGQGHLGPFNTLVAGYITIIGSRTIPSTHYQMLSDIGCIQTSRRYCIRSGGAVGSDEAGLQGALRSPRFSGVGMEIYLPWNGFKREGLETLYHDPSRGLFDSSRFHNIETAKAIALRARGSWNGLGRGGIGLHTRNAYQPLGMDLNTPSETVVCYAEPIGKGGGVKGGTNTAVRIALDRRIRVINIYKEVDYQLMQQFIEDHREYLA